VSNGAEFTLTEAAKQCKRPNASGQWSAVSRKTLQRALDKDKFPNAFRADGPAEGAWMIPKDDLIAQGFIPGAGRTETDIEETTTTQPSDVADLRRRAEVAEARSEERGKALDDMRTALRMLEAGQATTTVVESRRRRQKKQPADTGGP
jgi:hypothetical protein